MLVTAKLPAHHEPNAQVLLGRLHRQPADALLALIGQYRADPRPYKIDVGVGVYRDEHDATPVLRAVKAAERQLLATQTSKGYLGPEGDTGFLELLMPLAFGAHDFAGRLTGLQTPGGTGALRLGMELIATARPAAKLLIGTPTWPNHAPIIAAAGLQTTTYKYFEPATQTVCFDAMMTTFEAAQPGDVALLHGCCHNPTGADLDLAQWSQVAEVLARRGIMPFIDLAYQGLGRGLEADAQGLRLVLDAVDEALVAYSCDKNFALYRERTGALFALSRTSDAAQVTLSNLLGLARANWSMPPDHGAAIVRLILSSAALQQDWHAELATMRERLANVRIELAGTAPELKALGAQHGMFSTLPLGVEKVAELRDKHAVYMAGPGRINVAGLTSATVARFAAALAAVG